MTMYVAHVLCSLNVYVTLLWNPAIYVAGIIIILSLTLQIVTISLAFQMTHQSMYTYDSFIVLTLECFHTEKEVWRKWENNS